MKVLLVNTELICLCRVEAIQNCCLHMSLSVGFGFFENTGSCGKGVCAHFCENMSELWPGLGFFRGRSPSVIWIRVTWGGQYPSLLKEALVQQERKFGLIGNEKWKGVANESED